MPARPRVTDVPVVTVLVPARNEQRHIERCLEAIAAQDHDHERLEVLVVDGDSTDSTAEQARQAMERLGLSGKVLHNPVGSTPSNLNVGLARATGDFLCRVDARSLIPSDYVSRCVDVLTCLPNIAVVGGAQIAVPPAPGTVGLGIARALNNRWGMGLSRYRRAAASGPSDTVYLGAFRTADLREVGGWNERLGTNQDFDLNRRLGHRGVVWFDSALRVDYIPRSNLVDLFRQYRRFGRWKVRYWRMTGDRPQPRQRALIAAVPALAATAAVLACRPTWRLPALAAATVVASCVEVVGCAGPPTKSLPAHLASLGALGATGGGWLVGVWSEAVRRTDG